MKEDVKKDSVLQDHKKVGKKLIPPIIAQIGPFHEFSWKNQIIPEIIWTALLNKIHNYREGAELSVCLTKNVSDVLGKDIKDWFVKIESYSKLSIKEKEILLSNLNKEKEIFHKIKEALRPLIHFYPECPFEFLFEKNEISSKDEKGDLELLKNVIDELLDKTSIPATFAQANILYVGFCMGKLYVNRNISLAEFPKIQDYPATEISRRIAASIRSSMGHLFVEDDEPSEWAKYFWRRGMEIDACIL